MIINIQQAEGIVLDYLVSKAKGRGLGALEGDLLDLRIRQGIKPLPYSTDWAVGGPVYSASAISARFFGNESQWWIAYGREDKHRIYSGSTELLAKARCYAGNALSKDWQDVEVPDALIEVYGKR